MANKMITVVMYGFPAQYPVIFTDEDGTNTGKSVPMELLAGYVAAAANEKHINQVKICGNRERGDALAEDILFINRTDYANNNLEIEVVAE